MLTKQKIPQIALKDILKQFDIGKIKQIRSFATSGNITYTIKTIKKGYLLRISPLGSRWRSEKEIDAELEIINMLLKNKFPVPKPIKTKNGKEIIFWKNQFGYLAEIIKGKSKSKLSLKEIKKFGELLGEFHNLVEGYKTKNKRRHIWDLRTTKKNFRKDKKLILKNNFPWKEEFIKRFIDEISLLNFPEILSEGTIHEDLGIRHILWRKNKAAWKGDEIVGVLDFDRCYFGKLVLDLGQACRGWCFTDNWEKWSNENFKALILGYQNKRKLSHLEKKYLVDAVKFGILERGLSFCLRFSAVQDMEDAKFAMHSVSENGLLKIIEKNRAKIEKIIKTA